MHLQDVAVLSDDGVGLTWIALLGNHQGLDKKFAVFSDIMTIHINRTHDWIIVLGGDFELFLGQAVLDLSHAVVEVVRQSVPVAHYKIIFMYYCRRRLFHCVVVLSSAKQRKCVKTKV